MLRPGASAASLRATLTSRRRRSLIHLLREGGRGAIVLPDGTLFGEGVKKESIDNESENPNTQEELDKLDNDLSGSSDIDNVGGQDNPTDNNGVDSGDGGFIEPSVPENPGVGDVENPETLVTDGEISNPDDAENGSNGQSDAELSDETIQVDPPSKPIEENDPAYPPLK